MDLQQLKDFELVYKIREENCSDSLLTLSERHQGLIFQTMKKYANAAQCSGISFDDFKQDANLLVFNAAKKYDEDKNIKFSTWLGNTVRYHCLNTLHKESKYFNTENEELTTYISDKTGNQEEMARNDILEQVEYVKEILSQVKDKRVERIITLRYLSGDSKKKSFESIARSLDLSVQGVCDLHDSFMAFMKSKMRANSNMDEI